MTSLKVKDHSVSKKEFLLEYDADKHMYYTSPKPTKEELSSYYQSEDYISHTDGSRSLFEKLYQVVKEFTLSRKQKLLHSYLPRKGTALDIGAGTGDFLAHIKRHSWKTAGVEPNEQARKLAQDKGVKLVASLETVSGSFDAISMWHVLEHVYDLEEQIAWLKDHLAAGGSLFVAVPNFESWDAQYYKEFWAAYDVPRHLYHFSQKAIRGLFEEHKLEVVKIHPMIFDAYYVSLLSEKYMNKQMHFLKAMRAGFKSNRHARKSGNYSSLIYVIQHK